jgi:hypothetical protein
MAQKTNSAFKVKVGTVLSTLGIVPEKGAILFDESQGGPVVGDGFNWLTFEASGDGIALAANGDVFDNTMVAGVPVEPADYFSVIEYVIGTALTPVIIGQTVTINSDGSYRLNYFFNAQANTPNVTLLFDIAVNGVALGAPIVSFLPKKDTPVSFSGQFVIPGLVDTDELTLEIETDKSCELSRHGQKIGMTKVV